MCRDEAIGRMRGARCGFFHYIYNADGAVGRPIGSIGPIGPIEACGACRFAAGGTEPDDAGQRRKGLEMAGGEGAGRAGNGRQGMRPNVPGMAGRALPAWRSLLMRPAAAPGRRFLPVIAAGQRPMLSLAEAYGFPRPFFAASLASACRGVYNKKEHKFGKDVIRWRKHLLPV